MADRSNPLRSTPLHLVLLTIAAGSADATGYIGLGKIFPANMTGNIVLLGIALSEGHSAETWRALFVLLAFVTGTCVGGWVCRRVDKEKTWAPEITWIICGEAALLLAFAILWGWMSPQARTALGYPLLALLGLSMGLQGASAYLLGVPGIVTTVVTGTLTSLLTGIMKTRRTHSSASPGASVGLQTMVILAYGTGAAISGVLILHAQTWVGFFPAFIVLVVVGTRLGRD